MSREGPDGFSLGTGEVKAVDRAVFSAGDEALGVVRVPLEGLDVRGDVVLEYLVGGADIDKGDSVVVASREQH